MHIMVVWTGFCLPSASVLHLSAYILCAYQSGSRTKMHYDRKFCLVVCVFFFFHFEDWMVTEINKQFWLCRFSLFLNVLWNDVKSWSLFGVPESMGACLPRIPGILCSNQPLCTIVGILWIWNLLYGVNSYVHHVLKACINVVSWIVRTCWLDICMVVSVHQTQQCIRCKTLMNIV